MSPFPRARLGPAGVVLAAFVGVVLIATVATFPDVYRAVRGNPDLVAPLPLAHAALDIGGAGGTTFTGDHPWFIGFWSAAALVWVGLPTKLILIVPACLWLLTAGFVGAFWLRAGTRLGALVSFGLLLVLGRAMWPLVASWNGHGGTAQLSVTAGVLTAFAMQRLDRPRVAAAAFGAAGLAAGLAAASDQLGLFSSAIPLLVAVAVLHPSVARRRWSWDAAAAPAGVAAGYLGTVFLAAITHVRGSTHEVFLRSDLFGGLDALYRSVVVIWSDQSIFTDPVGAGTVPLILAFIGGWVLVVAAAVAVVTRLRGAHGQTGPRSRGEDAVPGDGTAAGRVPGDAVGTTAWTVYWATGFVLMPLAYIATSASTGGGPQDYATGRYLIVWWVSIAALCPLILGLRPLWLRRTGAAAAVVVVAVAGGRLLLDLAGHDRPRLYGEAVPLVWADAVQRAADAFHATHGYSGYFTSFSLGVGGSGDAPVYPVMTCGTPPNPTFCASGVASRPAMYRGNRGRSFVVLDTRPGAPPHALDALPDLHDRKIGTVAIAPGITMVVFAGDVGRFVERGFDQRVQHPPIPAP